MAGVARRAVAFRGALLLAGAAQALVRDARLGLAVGLKHGRRVLAGCRGDRALALRGVALGARGAVGVGAATGLAGTRGAVAAVGQAATGRGDRAQAHSVAGPRGL